MLNESNLIRLAIPGWTLTFSLIILFWINNPSVLHEIANADLVNTLGITVIIAGSGVPLGYLLNQIYFAFSWSNFNKEYHKEFFEEWFFNQTKIENLGVIKGRDSFYFFDYLWHKQLSTLEESRRVYIAERFSYLLGKKHALGTLFFSLLLVSILSVFVLIFTMSLLNLTFTLGIFFMTHMIFNNFIHYSNNVSSFQIFFLKSLLNKSTQED